MAVTRDQEKTLLVGWFATVRFDQPPPDPLPAVDPDPGDPDDDYPRP